MPVSTTANTFAPSSVANTYVPVHNVTVNTSGLFQPTPLMAPNPAAYPATVRALVGNARMDAQGNLLIDVNQVANIMKDMMGVRIQ